jgi:3-hydroxybutyryl-CoA dehydrogenase
MSTQQLNRLTVLGGGVLGGQIAWHSAFKGKQVMVYDLYEKGLEQCRADQQRYADIYLADLGASAADMEATRSRLSFTTDMATAAAQADLVIEAVPEAPEIKIATYGELAKYLPAHTLIATNSSTLLPSQFAAATGRPDKYCALHFANLIWQMNVAEVMAHAQTSEETLTAVTRFAIEIGMVPIPVRKEQNGYVINTWFVALLQASLSLVVNGVSTPQDVDRTFMITNGCAVGPCGMIDVVGMTTAYNISSYWGDLNKDEQMLKNAAFIKEHFLDTGKLGLQTGEGLYKYPDPEYAKPGFLDVPDLSRAEDIAKLAFPT